MAVAVVGDFLPGDPAGHVLGKAEEKSARKHAPLPPKPGPTAKTILADLKLRKAELEGVRDEYDLLKRALEAIKDI